MLKRIWLLGIMLLLVACGGGGGDNRPIDTAGPPLIVSRVPASGAVNVPPGTIVELVFSENIDPRSVSSATFQVMEVGEDRLARGTFHTAGNIVRFISDEITDNTLFRVFVTGVRDLDGQVMNTVEEWFFSTIGGPAPPSSTSSSTTDSSTTTILPTASFTPILGSPFLASSSVFFSRGGGNQAIFDRATGTVIVTIAGAPSDVSVRWPGIVIEAGVTYRVSFACPSVPVNRVQTEFKKNVTPFTSYDSAQAVCNGAVSVNLVPSESDGVNGRFNLNFGGAPGTYVFGPVTIEKAN
ncbi:MAG: Ig-like domain-containing protein [bacterium]|nr:Ig-like domain-containing protein [bacterium]